MGDFKLKNYRQVVKGSLTAKRIIEHFTSHQSRMLPGWCIDFLCLIIRHCAIK